MNADRTIKFHFAGWNFQSRPQPAQDIVVAGTATSSREIVMTPPRMSDRRSLTALAAALALAVLTCADAALASQGPGGGMGTAGNFTQLSMAVLVYGTSAIVVGAGLIGAVRRR